MMQRELEEAIIKTVMGIVDDSLHVTQQRLKADMQNFDKEVKESIKGALSNVKLEVSQVQQYVETLHQ